MWHTVAWLKENLHRLGECLTLRIIKRQLEQVPDVAHGLGDLGDDIVGSLAIAVAALAQRVRRRWEALQRGSQPLRTRFLMV